MALVYVIEDDDSIREIEEYALTSVGHKVVVFSSAKEFYEKLENVVPDICLVDIMLPDENGNEIVKKLRRNPDTVKIPVIIVTAKTTDIDLVKGFEDGADDYIKKPFSVMELVSRVKALLRRTGVMDVRILRLDELLINNEKREVYVDENKIELTYKEYELLLFFATNKGIVLDRNAIMNKVWGTYYEGESRTIDMHVNSLRKKLGRFGSRIKTVRNVGYVME